MATKEFHETIWKITASLILMKPANDEKLIFHLTRAPIKFFNAATMKVFFRPKVGANIVLFSNNIFFGIGYR